MATRNRVIYQSEALFVGPTPPSGVHFDTGDLTNNLQEIIRVQSINKSVDITRQDVNTFGKLSAIDRIILESPTVNLDFTYLLTDGSQEQALGLSVDGQVSAISGLLNKTEDEKNYFVLVTPEGTDAIGNTDRANHNVFAIGNGFLSNYNVEASVGSLPQGTVTVEALNIQLDANSSGNNIPAIDPEDGSPLLGETYVVPVPDERTGIVPALRPGDISLELATPFGAKLPGEFNEGTAHIQSFSIDAPVSREPLERLGSTFAFAREITFPVNITVNVSANLSDLKTGNLADIICNDEDYDLAINLNEPSCAGETTARSLRYEVRGAKLDSQSFASSIGANKTVDLTFTAQIGAAEELANGLFISGNVINA